MESGSDETANKKQSTNQGNDDYGRRVGGSAAVPVQCLAIQDLEMHDLKYVGP